MKDLYFDFGAEPSWAAAANRLNRFQYYVGEIKRQPNSIESTVTYVMDFDPATVWKSTDHANPATIAFAFEIVQGRVPINTFGIYIDPTKNTTVKSFEIQAADDYAGFTYVAIGTGVVDLSLAGGWQYFEIPVTLATHLKVQVGTNFGGARVEVNEMYFGVSKNWGDRQNPLFFAPAERFDPADHVDYGPYLAETLVCSMQEFPFQGDLNSDYKSWTRILPVSGGCSTHPSTSYQNGACDNDIETMAYISPPDVTTTFDDMYFQFNLNVQNAATGVYYALDVIEIYSRKGASAITKLAVHVKYNSTSRFQKVGTLAIDKTEQWTSFAMAAHRASAVRIYVVSTKGSTSATLPEIRFFSRKDSGASPTSWSDRPMSCIPAQGFSWNCLVSYCPSAVSQCLPSVWPRITGTYALGFPDDKQCCMSELVMNCVAPHQAATLNVKMSWGTSAGLTNGILNEYRLGTQYNIDGPSLSREELFVNYQGKTAERVIYRMEMDIKGKGSTAANDTALEAMFCTAPNTGATTFTPTMVGSFRARMYGLDIDGSDILVFKWEFNVVKRSFGLQPWWLNFTANSTNAFVDAGAVDTMLVDDVVTISSPCMHYTGSRTCAQGLFETPYGASTDATSSSSDGFRDITYTLSWENRTSPGESSFLVDTTSGLVKGSPAAPGNFIMYLMASDAAGTQATVMKWAFRVDPIPPNPVNWLLISVVSSVSTVLVLVSIGMVCYARNLKDEFALAMQQRNDPLSKIEQFISANREKLSKSVQITGQFKQEFDILFVKTCMAHFNANPGTLKALRDLHNKIAVAAQLRNKNKDPVQPALGLNKGNSIPGEKQIKYLELILGLIRKEEPFAADKLQELADKHEQDAANGRVEIHRGPVKTLDRILEKSDLKGHHFEVIRDYARASIIVEHVEQVAVVLASLESGNDFEILRCKNRLDPTYDSIESGGYRDYQLVTRVIGKEFSVQWLYEIQIMTREFYNLKTGNNDPNSAAAAHRAYKDFRRYKELGLRMQVQLDNMHKELKVLDSNFSNTMPRKGSIVVTKGMKAPMQEVGSSFPKGKSGKDKAAYLWNLTAKLSSSKPFSVRDGQTVTKRKSPKKKSNKISPEKARKGPSISLV